MQKFTKTTVQTIIDYQKFPEIQMTKHSILLGTYQPDSANWAYEVRLNIREGVIFVTQFGEIVPTRTHI